MLNSGKKIPASRDKKNKYSNSCVVRKKNSERNKNLLLPYCQPHRSIVSLDETLAKYESVQRLKSEAKTMPSTIEE
jgi:hypothetical protein